LVKEQAMAVLADIKEAITRELEGLAFVIGWGQGYDPVHAVPFFVRSRADLDRVIWNPLCVHNLATYLPKLKGKKVGVLCKGCDNRSIVQLLQEKLITREEIVIFGIPCRGVVDMNKIQALADGNEVIECSFTDKTITIKTAQGKKEVPLDDVLAAKCLVCQYPTPIIFDHLAGAAFSAQRPAAAVDDKVKEIEKLDIKERLAHWERELDRCIRCYVAAHACPAPCGSLYRLRGVRTGMPHGYTDPAYPP
jgi:formate dehydrogenase subunit beta